MSSKKITSMSLTPSEAKYLDIFTQTQLNKLYHGCFTKFKNDFIQNTLPANLTHPCNSSKKVTFAERKQDN